MNQYRAIAGFTLICASILLSASAAFSAGGLRVADVIAEDRFDGGQLPAGWAMAEDGKATSQRAAPENALVEMVFSLPVDLAKDINASLIIGPAGEGLIARATFGAKGYSARLAGSGADGKPATLTVPGIKAAAGFTSWAGRRATLGMAVSADRCRLLLNGNVIAELSAALPADRTIAVAFDNGINLQAVRILPGIADRFFVLSGAGLATLHGSERILPANKLRSATMESVRLDIDGVPMLAQGSEGCLASIDIAAEQFKNAFWTEGSGFITFPVPARPFKHAYLLIYRQGDEPTETPALGFGLRVPDSSTADLRNVYVGEVAVRSSDEGVTVQPVPELGPGWYLARVRMNQAATHWATHNADNTLLPLGKPSPRERPAYQAAAAGLSAYLCRPWTISGDNILGNRGLPHPERTPSSLRVAAVTFEEADFDLTVSGNGLGNVYCEPEEPRLAATLTNLTDARLTVRLTTELIPFERRPVQRATTVQLGPGESRTLDALAAKITERGHYKARIVADAGSAGRADYRTNLALLAPDTRKKENSSVSGPRCTATGRPRSSAST
jgi:hypothetical protein